MKKFVAVCHGCGHKLVNGDWQEYDGHVYCGHCVAELELSKEGRRRGKYLDP